MQHIYKVKSNTPKEIEGFNIFIRFLKENSLYSQYIREFYKHNNEYNYLSLEKRFNTSLKWLGSAFPWNETYLGWTKWQDTCSRWVLIVYRHGFHLQ